MNSSRLDPDELRSLRALTHGAAREHIPATHAARLIALGYARESAAGLAITMLGRAALVALTDWPSGQTPPQPAAPAVRSDPLTPE